MPRSNQPSVGVIGAGPGGLACAMLLAASGLRVEVFEAQSVIGGRTSRLTLGDYAFDIGPTFFLMPYILEEVFAATGRRLTDYARMHRLDPMYRLVMPRRGQGDLTLDCTQDPHEMTRRLARINERDARRFIPCLEANRRKLAAFEPILRSPWPTLTSLASAKLLRAAPHLSPHRSVHSWLARRFEDPHIRLALCFQSKYLGMSPYHCPSLFSILPFIEYEFGVWHPVGGCNALMNAMADVCDELGVRIHTNAPVTELTFNGRTATGLVARGERHAFDHVVMNADASWAMRNLVPARLRPSWSDRTLDGMKSSCSTFMLYLGIDGRIDLPHHTIRTARDYERNIDDITTSLRLSDDPSIYICNPSRLDPTLAPAGRSSLYVLAPVANNQSGIDWPREAPAFRQRVLDRVSELAGRDIRPLIRAEKTVTPHDWESQRIHRGSTFNLAHNLGQMLCFRPQHRLPDTTNLWLVGGGTHPGSGLPVIFLSSQITARLLCESLGVRYAGANGCRGADATMPQPVGAV